MAAFEWLGNILLRIGSYPRGHALYVEGGFPFEVKTRTLVLGKDEEEDSGEVPALALQHGLQRTLSVWQADDVVDNARQQRPEASPAELVQAFNHYWDRDAFIDFGVSPGARNRRA